MKKKINIAAMSGRPRGNAGRKEAVVRSYGIVEYP